LREAIEKQKANVPIQKSPVIEYEEPSVQRYVEPARMAGLDRTIYRRGDDGKLYPTNERLWTDGVEWKNVQEQTVEWPTTYRRPVTHVHSPVQTPTTPRETDVDAWNKNQLVLTKPKCRQNIKFSETQKRCIATRCPRTGSLAAQKRCHRSRCGVKASQYGKTTCKCRGNQKWSKS
jgi:hypothetical protein